MSDTDDKQLLDRSSDGYGSTTNMYGYDPVDGEDSKSLSKSLNRQKMKKGVSLFDVEVPITLSWSNINVFVQTKKGCFSKDKIVEPPKQILRNVNGIVSPGSLLAVMGASGSGKTTLMNVLTSRNNGALLIDGTVKVNGQIMGRQIANISAYVQQEDLFVGTMTVKEHLMFHANLRLGDNLSVYEKEQKVSEVISEMGLMKSTNTFIGIPGMVKGLSGGEKKRLSFASEVLTNPSLMFCDEPTSGLDSFMAQSVIECLKNMASRGRTILCTIHQPSSEVYSLMDEVLLMAEGMVAYMGPTDNVLNFFKSIGYPCPENYNPADFFIHKLAVVPGNETECRATVKKVVDYFEASAYNRKILTMINEVSQDDQFVIEMDNLDNMYKHSEGKQNNGSDGVLYHTTWYKQFSELFKRCWLGNIRNPMITRARVVQIIVLGILYSLFYLQQYDDGYDQRAVQNINGAFVIMQAQLVIGNVFSVANAFPSEYGLFLREHGNHMYQKSAYYLSRVCADLPIFIIVPIILICITYYLIGFYPEWDSFLIMNLIFILISICAISFGHFMGCTTGDVTLVLILVAALQGPPLLYSGYFLNLDSIPVYLKPFQFFAIYFYSMELLMVNQWKDVDSLNCEYKTPVSSNGTIHLEEDEAQCFTTGLDVLNSYSFSEDNVTFKSVGMVCLFLFYEVMGFLLLYMRSRKNK